MSSEIKSITIKDCEVTFEYPSADEVKKCLKNNADLLGKVTVTRGEESQSALLPLPFEGVFVFRGFGHGRADLMVWSAFLGKSSRRKKSCGNPDVKWLYNYSRYLQEVIGRRITAAKGKLDELNLEGLLPVRAFKAKGLLMPARPNNPLDLLAGINGVRRFNVSRHTAGLFGADKRFNLTKFNGRICPIETPESEMVGIQLQLARGAKVEADGAITPVRSSAPLIDKLGWGASLIPFVNFNDSARNTIGAKNLRQALVLEGREAPLVKTGSEKALVKRMKPLMEVGACPKALDEKGELALGCNLLVAYMPWFGWNIEDAIVVSESTAKKMSAHDRQGELLPLKLGDKLTGRHGNKGVVSKIEPDDQMPKIVLADGREVFADIILNPHGIISRMNPGQLLETHLGWLFKEGVKSTQVMADGGPNHGRIRKLLKEHGLDDRGRAKVILPDGTSTENPVVVGYQYFVRLNHIPSDKSHADRTQRLGEMEVWALAAHEAYGLLKEKLGTGFEPMLKDWLLPLGIGLERSQDQKKIRFRKLNDTELLEAMIVKDVLGNPLPPQEVSVKADASGYDETFRATYGCKKVGCRFRVDGAYGGGGLTVKMDDVLHGMGIYNWKEVRLEDLPAGGGYLLNNGGGLLKIVRGESRSATSSVYKAEYRGFDGLVLYGYYQGRHRGEYEPKVHDFDVCCSEHPTQKLRRISDMADRKAQPKTGGLFDPAIFGDGRWGYIRLQTPVNGLTIVPVLPLKYRKALVEGMMDEVSEAYVQVLRVREKDDSQWAVRELEKVVEGRLFGLIQRGKHKTKEKSKRGLFRRLGLGREVEHAARQVIVPNPELQWDEVGVPSSIYKALNDDGLKFDDELWVLNRQPTLHKYGMQALRPRIMKGDEHVFQISPLVCEGFAADFDGDEMVAHCPKSGRGQDDAKKLLPENNLLSWATGKPMVYFGRDFKSGAYLLQDKHDESTMERVEQSIREMSENSSTAVKKLSEFARRSFAAVTRNGASFGFYDLLDWKNGQKSAALELIVKNARANGKDVHMDAIRDDFIGGMDSKRFFVQSNLGRARLCTKKLNSAKAGGMTRQLVLKLWPLLRVKGLQTAQAFGELALQLTQDSAHDEVFDVNQARKRFLRAGRDLRLDDDGLPDVAKVPKEYRQLKQEVLDCWNQVYGENAQPVTDENKLTELAKGKCQLAIVRSLAESGMEVELTSPFGKVWFNEF